MDALKLIALDKDDLEIISTHLQDAVVNVGDIVWLRSEKRVVLALNRFDWEAASAESPQYQRRRTALRFERVNAVKCRNVRPLDKNAVLSLLAVDFTESDPPAGVIVLTFSGDAALRLEVECLEAEIADLGPAWATARCPDHSVEIAETRR
jgi:Protein of unknown function (DUF2948)